MFKFIFQKNILMSHPLVQDLLHKDAVYELKRLGFLIERKVVDNNKSSDVDKSDSNNNFDFNCDSVSNNKDDENMQTNSNNRLLF